MARAALVAAIVLFVGFLFPAQAAVPELRQPAWAQLTLEQQQILAPLAPEWDKMDAYRKKKWLGIAARYATMKPEEQARMQRRMKDWAGLTPEQRQRARAQYKSLSQAPPEHKESVKQKWQEYKQLPEDERKRLADKAAHRYTPKPGANKLSTGASAPKTPAIGPARTAPTTAPATSPATANTASPAPQPGSAPAAPAQP